MHFYYCRVAGFEWFAFLPVVTSTGTVVDGDLKCVTLIIILVPCSHPLMSIVKPGFGPGGRVKPANPENKGS